MSDWTFDDAQAHLLNLELFGMSLGLERMHELLARLGSPQKDVRAIHVVGTNGKSSTTRMTQSILAAHGLNTGAFLSPHLISFAERIRIGDDEIAPDVFAATVQAVAQAARTIEAERAPGDHVTQFELLTATALLAFARSGAQVAVVEAGLGGRLDATNVLNAEVVVLTSVGLEHTRWLGETQAAIAGEKLAVLTPGATLVSGPLSDEARAVARAAVEREAAVWVPVAADPEPATLEGLHGTQGSQLVGYQQGNWRLAEAAAAALIGPLDMAALRDARAAVRVPGRLHVVSHEPLTILDGAHNPDGMRALAGTLDGLSTGRPLVCVIAILDDKDAAEMLAPLWSRARQVVFTRAANPRGIDPAVLAGLARDFDSAALAELATPARAAGPQVLEEPDPRRALAAAQAAAGPSGVVVATGSIYLVAELLDSSGTRVASIR